MEKINLVTFLDYLFTFNDGTIRIVASEYECIYEEDCCSFCGRINEEHWSSESKPEDYYVSSLTVAYNNDVEIFVIKY